MGKHKHQDEAGILTLEAAVEATARAEAALRDASAAVQAVVDRWPGASRDRRWLESLPRSGHRMNPDLPGLGRGERETIRNWIDFDKAVAIEADRNREFLTAKAAEDELRRAADVAALGDGRAALADIIAGIAEAERELGACAAAYDEASEAVYAAQRAVDDAGPAIDVAKSAAADFATASLLGKAGPAPRTVKQARIDLQDAEDSLDTARATRDALEAKRTSIAQSLNIKRMNLDDAVKHVVRVHPSTRAVVTEFSRVHGQWLRLKGTVDALYSGGMLPEGANPFAFPPGAATAGAVQWKAAVAALRADATAELPKV